VQPEDLDAFFARYAEVCRAGMDALKKRDRSKGKRRKKNKAGGAGGK
jgi:signal recognition particle subunit SRP14